jgi:hemerythrin-like domain-containing protein
MDSARRQWLTGIGGASAALILTACNKQSSPATEEKKNDSAKAAEVTAVEDLMREHGVLRRALLIYSAVASKLRNSGSSISPDALLQTAKLFRGFGEEYHEKKLEEAYIFPAVQRAGGPAAALPDILIAQHNRGREITDYIIALANSGKLSGATEALAGALESFVLMYRNHAAREDTIIFPAWKQTLTAKQLDEIGDKFEEIEQQQFGKDGYEDAVKQIGEIEVTLGLSDLGQFTAPPPPPLPQT